MWEALAKCLSFINLSTRVPQLLHVHFKILAFQSPGRRSSVRTSLLGLPCSSHKTLHCISPTMSQVYPETYTNGRTENRGRIAVIGGGLVGCVAALQLAKKGYQIDLYESRSDIRKAVVVAGRSINLALSARGRKALAEVLLEDKILYDALPMEGRMLHSVSGSTRVVPYDQKNKQVEQFNRFTSFVRNYFLE